MQSYDGAPCGARVKLSVEEHEPITSAGPYSMEVPLFASNGQGDRLKVAIGDLLPEIRVEIHRSVDSLSRWLCSPSRYSSPRIVLLLAAHKQDLLDFIAMEGPLSDMSIILILPDLERETVTEGLKLRPRFFTDIDSDFEEVAAVLAKMIKNAKERMW